MFLGRLDVENRSFAYASAGHQGYLLRANGESGIQILPSTSVPLGIQENWNSPSSPATPMNAGDLIVLPTDGFEETMNSDHESFGREPMFEVIRNHQENSAAEIIEALYLAARDFAQDEPQKDDMTAIVVKVL